MKHIIKYWLIFIVLMMMVGRCMTSCTNNNEHEFKEGNIVVLGENGSLRLATSEDIDNDTLGMIVKGIFYKDIKLEVGQVWHLPNYGINIKILGLNSDYIETLNIEFNVKTYYSIELFTMYDMELIESPDGFITVRGTVKGINTKDIY